MQRQLFVFYFAFSHRSRLSLEVPLIFLESCDPGPSFSKKILFGKVCTLIGTECCSRSRFAPWTKQYRLLPHQLPNLDADLRGFICFWPKHMRCLARNSQGAASHFILIYLSFMGQKSGQNSWIAALGRVFDGNIWSRHRGMVGPWLGTAWLFLFIFLRIYPAISKNM